MAHNGNGGPNKLAIVVGFGIGITWIVLASLALIAAARGNAVGRPDYGLAWGLVGFLLFAAGACSIVGTWWHTLRRPAHD